MKHVATLKLALEALEWEEAQTDYPSQFLKKAIKDLRQAIAEAEQVQPFAYFFEEYSYEGQRSTWFVAMPCDGKLNGKSGIPIYTIPPRQPWVGLTNEEWETTHWSPDFRAGAKWAEAKLKDKNT